MPTPAVIHSLSLPTSSHHLFKCLLNILKRFLVAFQILFIYYSSLLPASLRVTNLFLHADSLMKEAINVFETQNAVCHALHGTAKTEHQALVVRKKAGGVVWTLNFKRVHRLTCMHTPHCRWLLDFVLPSSACLSEGEINKSKTQNELKEAHNTYFTHNMLFLGFKINSKYFTSSLLKTKSVI